MAILTEDIFFTNEAFDMYRHHSKIFQKFLSFTFLNLLVQLCKKCLSSMENLAIFYLIKGRHGNKVEE